MTKTSKRADLNQAFIAALADDWEKHGADVITGLRISRPEVYASLVAKLVPQRVEVSDGANVFDGMSGDEIEQWLINEYASNPDQWTRFRLRVQSLIDSGDPIVQIVLDDSTAAPSRPRGRRPGVPIVQS